MLEYSRDGWRERERVRKVASDCERVLQILLATTVGGRKLVEVFGEEVAHCCY